MMKIKERDLCKKISNRELGAIYSKEKTIFRVWSFSENDIKLCLYKDYRDIYREVYDMKKYEDGCFELEIEGDLEGMYYTYLIGKNEVSDPYSISSSINSIKSAIIDLETTNPVGFKNHNIPDNKINDAIICELSIKDLTALDSSNTKFKGKFLSLTEENTSYKGVSTGLDHLVELGVTHVQLMPIYDFFTVDENPDLDYEDDNYNWGYDPELYNNVEGSYSTDPYNPKARIYELKKMIMKLHEKGISVVMDVVYNHTYKTFDSNFEAISPSYYYRQFPNSYCNGSGCGNDFASERPMVRKFILESLLYWQNEFKIDGFRFDLMALIDLDTINIIIKELRKNNPNTIIYGEPWMALDTNLSIDQRIYFGSQVNRGFGLFNAEFRDGIKGDNDGYINGFVQGDFSKKNSVERGIVANVKYDDIRGGILENASESINYFNSHDNLILNDKLVITLENENEIDDVTKLSFSILMLAQGIPFFHVGNEFKRSKKFNHNTYNLPLSVNGVDWNDKYENMDLFSYVKDLIEFRKRHDEFKLENVEEIKKRLTFLDFSYGNIMYMIKNEDGFILVVHNCEREEKNIDIHSFLRENEVGKYNIKLVFDKNGNKDVEINEDILNISSLSTMVFEFIYNFKEVCKMSYKERYEKWLNSEIIDEDTKKELLEIKDEEEIQDRFYQDLEFGTAGLRGVLGAGSNRMNKYNVGLAGQGLALTIIDYGKEAMDKGVTIGYDVRHGSKEFAKLTSQILAANGIKSYIFEDITPTPVVSYTIRKLGTISGVMVTASHNPRDYNGYKVYWEEGSQILSDIADQISAYYKKLDFSEIKVMDFDEGKEKGLINVIGSDLIDSYINDVLELTINDENIDKSIKMVYTPLNGTGNKFVRRVLKERGFENVYVVKEQENPDPDFKTAPYPNPDTPTVYAYAEKLGKEVNADLLLATDPDSDRLSVEVLHDGEYVFLNGNEIGSLFTQYILNGLNEKGQIPENGVVVRSIVTSDIIDRIAESYGVETVEVLTGFKNIYATQNEYDKTGEKQYIFGFEESIGYSYGTNVRDKDGVSSSMMMAEMAGYYKEKGKTLIDALNDIYDEFGYYVGDLQSIVLEGQSGKAVINEIMEDFRNNPIKEMGDSKLVKTTDFENDNTGLPKSNVLRYTYDDKSWYALRPSGTEPKIKLYIYSVADNMNDAKEKVKLIKDAADEKMDKIINR